MIGCSLIIATYGDRSWQDMARDHAYPSTLDQPFLETIIWHEPFESLSTARNRAAYRARGDWLCFLDADDKLARSYMVEMAWPIRIHEKRVLLVPSVSWVRDGVQSRPEIPNVGNFPMMNECVIGTLIPKDLFVEVGGFREFPSIEDYDLFLRCYDAGARLIYVPSAIYLAYMHASSRNSDQSCYQQIWQEHLDRIAA